jgi:hypothetical protein
MFKLIAFLFLISAPEKPVAAFSYEDTFKSRKECEEYNKSAKSKAAQKTIAATLKKQDLAAKFVCIEAKDTPKSEDNTI